MFSLSFMVLKASVSRVLTFLSTGAILAIRSCPAIGSVEEVSTNVIAIVFIVLLKFINMFLSNTLKYVCVLKLQPQRK